MFSDSFMPLFSGYNVNNTILCALLFLIRDLWIQNFLRALLVKGDLGF